MSLEELKAAYKKAINKQHKALNEAPPGMDFQEYENYMYPFYEDSSKISVKLRLAKTPVMKPQATYGDLMTIENFIENCEGGGFIDYDGSGNYATATEESDISIYPSDIISGVYRKDFTHIMWYNK